jgi:guanylate kinase
MFSMASSSPGRVIIISGPSGSGKTTLLKQLLARCNRLVPSVSATTRAPRQGEVNDVDYHFLTKQEFDRRREQGDFLEYAEVFGSGDWYGTLKDEVAPRLAAWKWVVLEIDMQGTQSVLRLYPDAVTIFVRPETQDAETLEELERRLRSRGTESESSIQRRLNAARQELVGASMYRFQVTNQNVDRAVDQILNILGSPEDRNA